MRKGIVLLAAFVVYTTAGSVQNRAAEHRPNLKIVSVDYKVADGCGVYLCVDWKVKVANQTGRTLRLMGKVKFLDADGYMVDGDMFTGYIDGGHSRTFTGQVPMPADDANRIASAKATIVDNY